jgi:nucleotide-binding universal stress UspA family protein
MDESNAAPVPGTGGRSRVVVGIDGSTGSRDALVQAFLAAARRRADLDVVANYTLDLHWLGGRPVDVPNVGAVRQDTEARARVLVQEVQEEVVGSAIPGIGDLAVELFVSAGPAAQALLDRADGADLLVVGSRGRGAVRSALLGSVALHCVAHAPCPVLVVHSEAVRESNPPKVIVGVDGSAASRAALVAAIDEAGARSADLDVLSTFEITNYWTDMASIVIPSVGEIEDELRRRTEHLVKEVVEGRTGGRPVPHIRVVVAQGPADEVLVQRGRDAELLVVGSRGHGEFRGLLLGSVSLYTAMHAPCPVMVVRPKGGTAADDRTRSEAALTER